MLVDYQLQILTFLSLPTSIAFAIGSYNLAKENGFGLHQVFAMLLLVLAARLFYWMYYTKEGKDFTREYNNNQKEALKRQRIEIQTYHKSRGQVFYGTKDFLPLRSIFSFDNKSAISIDEKSKKVCLLTNSKPFFLIGSFDTRHIYKEIIQYGDIVEVSLIEDGDTVTTTSRTSQVVGAIVGNAILGGVGLVIGAVTGSKKTSATVNHLEVRLVINNIQSPVWSIVFIKSEVPRKGLVYQNAINEANELLGLIKIIIKQVDNELKNIQPQQINLLPTSERTIVNSTDSSNINLTVVASTIIHHFNTQRIIAEARVQDDLLQISLTSANNDLDKITQDVSHTKKNPPPNHWQALVDRDIHNLDPVEWVDNNIENIIRSYIMGTGYWGDIEYIYPNPSRENRWLFDEKTNSCTGFFIACYDELYGAWSHHYAYRSHFFEVCFDNRPSYYRGNDAPELIVEDFRDRGKEIVPWDKSLTNDHPVLQAAKTECTKLGLNKSIATRIWNKNTLETFGSAWEIRKKKDLSD